MRGGARLKGTLRLSRRRVDPPTTPAVTCDSDYFNGQVMGRVLTICVNCHSAGGSAQTTSFRVQTDDPQATQASVALHIDRQDPSVSRILQKPLALIPHPLGGIHEDEVVRKAGLALESVLKAVTRS